jgi:hypothetical protein
VKYRRGNSAPPSSILLEQRLSITVYSAFQVIYLLFTLPPRPGPIWMLSLLPQLKCQRTRRICVQPVSLHNSDINNVRVHADSRVVLKLFVRYRRERSRDTVSGQTSAHMRELTRTWVCTTERDLTISCTRFSNQHRISCENIPKECKRYLFAPHTAVGVL